MAFNLPQFVSPTFGQRKSPQELEAERQARLARGREATSNLLSGLRGFGRNVSTFFRTSAERKMGVADQAVKEPFQFTPQVGGFKIPVPNLIGSGAVVSSEPARAQFINDVSDLQSREEMLFTPAPAPDLEGAKAGVAATPAEGAPAQAAPKAITFQSANPAFQNLIEQTNQLIETAKQKGALTPEIQDAINQINNFEAQKLTALANARDATDSQDPVALNESISSAREIEKKEKDIVSQLIEEMRAARVEFLETGLPSERETELQRQLQKLRSGREILPIELRQEGIPAEGIGARIVEDERVRAIREGNLLFELGLEQEGRQFKQAAAQTQLGFIRDDLDLQFKIEDRLASQEEKVFERARTLRGDALSALSNIVDTFEGFAFEDLDADSQGQILDLARNFNIPASVLTSAMKASKHRFIFENAKVLGGVGGVAIPTTPEEEQAVLRNLVSGLPAGQQEGMFGAIAAFKNARDLISLLDKGVKTGPISGRIRRIGQTLGLTGEDFNKFNAATTAFTANYIKALSGVQVSDKEREFLMKALPAPTNQENVNRDNLAVLTDFLKNKLELQLGINVDNFPNEIPQADSISLGIPAADAYLDIVLDELNK